MSERAEYRRALTEGRTPNPDFRGGEVICPECGRAVLQSWEVACWRCREALRAERETECAVDARADADRGPETLDDVTPDTFDDEEPPL